MFRLVAVLFLSALSALAAEQSGPTPTPVPSQAPLPGMENFRLFLDYRVYLPVRLELLGQHEKLTIRQPGDPDSVISPGSPTPSRQVALKPAFEINDILLKAYQPDPTVDPHDNRSRGAGAFSAIDVAGRPYQLRLGARLVW